MSKKTFFKRIALAAIAALGLGMLSVAPSYALSSTTLAIDADDAISTGESATAVVTLTMTGTATGDSATVRAYITSSNAQYVTNLYLKPTESRTNLTTTTGASATSPIVSFGVLTDRPAGTAFENAYPNILDTTKLNTASTANFDSSSVTLNAGATATVKYTLGLYNVSTAGTYTVKIESYTRDGVSVLANSASATWTVTVTAADTKASSASSVTLRTGDGTNSGNYWNGTREGLDSSTSALRRSTSTDITPDYALIVNQKSATGTNIARESFTVTVSGEAWVGDAVLTTTRPNSGNGTKSVTFASAAAGSQTEVWLWSTGTAGTATVSVVTASGLTLGTKTITFTGLASKIEISSVQKKIIRAGTTTAQSGAVIIKASDSSGNGVPGRTAWSALTSNAGAIASASCAEDTTLGVGLYVCSVTPASTSTSGSSATITFRLVDASVTTSTAYLTVTQAFTMGGAVSTVVLTTDKATYEPGEYMKITATAKDSSGNAPYDGQSGPTLTANKNLGSSSISMNTYLAGVSTSDTRDPDDVNTILNSKNLFAPAASGKFTITGVNGLGAAISVTATVSDDASTAAAAAATDAALEAIDAANAATDAANLAAEAADAATVAAEEARDAADAATAAVEALATEVATLMAALKAQITTLANTVAKIAKKVKA
jgi:hypothetical protein